jgi:hypothetical protein
MATSRAGGRAAAAAAATAAAAASKSGKSSKGKAAKISGRKAAAAASSSSSKRTSKSKAKSNTTNSSTNSSSSVSSSSSKLRVVACDDDEESHSVTAKQAERDAFLSHFHALGKLLYAKRILPESSISSSGSSNSAAAARAAKTEAEAALGADYYKLPLEFSPEDVLHRSSLSVDGAAAFLQVSCVCKQYSTTLLLLVISLLCSIVCTHEQSRQYGCLCRA